jgi:hypothetical protein
LSTYFLRPREGIADPDAGRLWASPEFQILWPVVVAYPVAVFALLWLPALAQIPRTACWVAQVPA